MKTYGDFLNKLGARESRGNYKAVNKDGFLGKYQMGEEALIDAGYYTKDGTKKNDWGGTWTGKDGVTSKNDFLNNAQAQENAIHSYIDKQWSYITYYDLNFYIGDTINGTEITKSGLIAGAHLVGIGGLKRYLESDGKNNVRDRNGTPISSYIDKFGDYEIGDSGTPSPQPPPGDEYTIKSGDTLSRIAKEYGLTLGQLLDANPEITNPNLIISGQKIRIPQINDGKPGLNLNPDCSIPQESFDNQLLQCHQSFTTAITAAPPAPRGCPLVLDLDGDGVETTSLNDGSYFDHDANGFAEKTGWVASDDGLLVWDRNGDGIINNGKELFGDQTILKSGTKAANGFQALADLDDNKDGKIDANDSAFGQLKVWRDFDGDGYSSIDELYTLNELGITALNTGYTNSNTTDANGNIRMLAGTFKRLDGTTGQMDDYSFRRDTTYTIANEWLDVPADIAALPDLQAYGNVYDFQQAMVRDSSGQLKSLVEQFIAATDPSVRNSVMDQILFKWTGSDGINPTSRGPNIDGRKLAVLEKFFAQAFVGVSGSNPNVTAGGLLNQSYRGIFEMFYAGLMSQTHLKDLYDKISYTWGETTQSLKGDLTAVKTELENRCGVDPILGETAGGEFIRSVKGFQAETMLGLDTFRSNRTFSWLMDSYGPPSQIDGTSANDTLVGTAGADGIRGGGGNDTISGGDGNDVLYGGPGDDVIDGGSGADTLIGGPGNDTLGGAYVSNDWYGYGGGNTYEGGLGNDTLRGTCAGDLYKFNLGDGQDVVVEPNWSGVVGTDILRFGLGIAPSDIKVVRSGNDLVFSHVNGVDKVTVQGWYLNGYTQLERLEFADGSAFNLSDVQLGTTGNDVLNGISADSIMMGDAGDDTLNGGAGNDLINGGPGNDIMVGSAGNDTYVFGRGYGGDTINDYDTTAGNSDKVKLGSGVNPLDLIFVNSGSNLNIQINNSSDLLTVQNQNLSSAYQVEVFEASDGSKLLSSKVGLLIQEMAGLSSSTGMSWKQLIQNKPNDVQTILSHYWQPPQ